MTAFPLLPVAKDKRLVMDRVVLALAVAFVVVFVSGLVFLEHVARQRSGASREAEDFVQTLEDANELLPDLTVVFGSGMSPAPDVVADRLKKARGDFENHLTRIRADLQKLSAAAERDGLLAELDAIRKPVDDMAAQTGKPPPRGANAAAAAQERAKALDKYYQEALEAWTQFKQHARQVEHQLFQEQERVAATFLNLEYIIAAILLLLVLGAAIYFRERAGREHRTVEEKERLLSQMSETELKYRSIFDNAVEGIFQTTPEGRFITANHALAKMYGYSSPEELMEKLTDITTQLYVDPSQRLALFEALKEADIVSNFEVEVIRVDGRTIWARENVRAVKDSAGRLLYLEGTVEDISGKWWAEQRRKLHYDAARVLSEAASVDEARPKILRTICETLEWDMGAVWNVDAEADVMHCVEIWCVPEVDVADFERVNSEAEIRRGEGLAGQAWTTGEPHWIADLETAENYANAALALACGMSSAFAVPVRVNDDVVHVLEFFSPKISVSDPELLQTLGGIASELGHMIERKRAEEALRKSEMRKAAILQSALDCIITFDLDGKIIEFNPAAERAFGYKAADALGREFASLIFPDLPLTKERPGLALYYATRDGGTGKRRELVARRADRTECPVELAVSRIIIDG
ncbi:MAG TPA: PAS domain S-box protein, partial [Chthoniobacteraceae bacterium]|nr:PAS domain S-box protein [Chthoniobacteraceae bacterium]